MWWWGVTAKNRAEQVVTRVKDDSSTDACIFQALHGRCRNTLILTLESRSQVPIFHEQDRENEKESARARERERDR